MSSWLINIIMKASSFIDRSQDPDKSSTCPPPTLSSQQCSKWALLCTGLTSRLVLRRATRHCSSLREDLCQHEWRWVPGSSPGLNSRQRTGAANNQGLSSDYVSEAVHTRRGRSHLFCSQDLAWLPHRARPRKARQTGAWDERMRPGHAAHTGKSWLKCHTLRPTQRLAFNAPNGRGNISIRLLSTDWPCYCDWGQSGTRVHTQPSSSRNFELPVKEIKFREKERHVSDIIKAVAQGQGKEGRCRMHHSIRGWGDGRSSWQHGVSSRI